MPHQKTVRAQEGLDSLENGLVPGPGPQIIDHCPVTGTAGPLSTPLDLALYLRKKSPTVSSSCLPSLENKGLG